MMLCSQNSLIPILVTISLVQAQQPSNSEPRLSNRDELGGRSFFKPGTQNSESSLSKGCVCVHSSKCDRRNIVDDGSGRVKFCGIYGVCCSTSSTRTQQSYASRCGVRKPYGVNGTTTSHHARGQSEFGEWPWQVILKEKKNGESFCGGAIISSRYIITSAHCVAYLGSSDLLQIRLGEWNTADTNELLPHKDMNVERFIVHPEYAKKSHKNDIALIKLTDPIEFAPHIDTICLPNSYETHDNQYCIATGWGMRSNQNNNRVNGTSILSEILLKVIPGEECQTALRKTKALSNFTLEKGWMCAGGEGGRDTCAGFGGGPLVCHRSDGTYSLTGLVSWGYGCGRKGFPGVYTDVKYYLEWISSQIGG